MKVPGDRQSLLYPRHGTGLGARLRGCQNDLNLDPVSKTPQFGIELSLVKKVTAKGSGAIDHTFHKYAVLYLPTTMPMTPMSASPSYFYSLKISFWQNAERSKAIWEASSTDSR